MAEYSYVCTVCENEIIIAGSMKDGPPDMENKACECGSVGTWLRGWNAPSVVWKASGGTRGTITDAQRASGEFVVDRR